MWGPNRCKDEECEDQSNGATRQGGRKGETSRDAITTGRRSRKCEDVEGSERMVKDLWGWWGIYEYDEGTVRMVRDLWGCWGICEDGWFWSVRRRGGGGGWEPLNICERRLGVTRGGVVEERSNWCWRLLGAVGGGSWLCDDWPLSYVPTYTYTVEWWRSKYVLGSAWFSVDTTIARI